MGNHLSVMVSIVAAIAMAIDPASSQQGRAITLEDCVSALYPPGQTPQPLTVAAMIQLRLPLLTVRGSTLEAVHTAPDGTHFLALFYHGDIDHNGNWVTFVYGDVASLDSAARVDTSLRLFSAANVPAHEWVIALRWLDDREQIAFLWNDGQRPAQIMQANLRTHQLQAITDHPTAILNFDISRDGETAVFAARGEAQRDAAAQERKKKYQTEGFALGDQTVWSIVKGDYDGWTPDYARVFILNRREKRLQEVSIPGFSWLLSEPQAIQISPDGKYCLLDHRITSLPQRWSAYTNPWLRQKFSAAQKDLQGNFFLRQQFLLDVATGSLRPLWDAPLNPYVASLWSDSTHVVLGPAYLPVDHADADGLEGNALAELNVETGQFVSLPLQREDLAASKNSGYKPLAARSGGTYEFGVARDMNGEVKLRLKKDTTTGAWSRFSQQDGSKRDAAPVRIELREDSNTPPALYAVDGRSGQEIKVYDPNPGLLSRYTLAHTELVHWREANDTPWTGLLYYPVGYVAGHRYPLVIHTHGYSWVASSFGAALAGGHTTAYAAQALANRGIAVLCLRYPDHFEEQGLFEKYMNTPREPQTVLAGIESAAQHLSSIGLIQPDKVGVVGFSRPGWYVEYLLTHSSYPFAAAIAADNLHNDYGEYILLPNAQKIDEENAMGAKPYGGGLLTWLREAPGFNADKIHTPLRLENDSDMLSVLGRQELFGNLRYLGRPVEEFFVSDIEHGGAHPLVNPAQRLASQGGAVDWFDFWLQGHEDPDPSKADQYKRWRELRKLHEENAAKTGAQSPN